MRRVLLLPFILFLLPLVSSICNSGQIDINSASLSDLDQLSGIGSAKAQAIVDTRPFANVDDLLRVSGIGNVTLANIKTQGLACVSSESEQADEPEEDTTVETVPDSKNDSSAVSPEEEKSTTLDAKVNVTIAEPRKISSKSSVDGETINLNPQDIKTDSNKESLSKEDYALYSLVVFSVLLSILFFIKTNRYKTEFK